MQLRRQSKSFQDVDYNIQLIDRLLKGQGLDGDYIREIPAVKVTGLQEELTSISDHADALVLALANGEYEEGGTFIDGTSIVSPIIAGTEGRFSGELKVGIGNNLAGISGVGTLGTSVRFWAGHSTKTSAPFRVLQDGSVVANNVVAFGGRFTDDVIVGAGNNLVGISGLGSGASDVRFWAGHATRSAAPFRVLQDGSVVANNVVAFGGRFTGDVIVGVGNNLAGISGVGTSGASVRFWAGNTNRSAAPFRVLQDGSVVATKVVGLEGVFASLLAGNISGARLHMSLSGSSPFLDMYDSNNKKRITLLQDRINFLDENAVVRGHIRARYSAQGFSVLDIIGGSTIIETSEDGYQGSAAYGQLGVLQGSARLYTKHGSLFSGMWLQATDSSSEGWPGFNTGIEIASSGDIVVSTTAKLYMGYDPSYGLDLGATGDQAHRYARLSRIGLGSNPSTSYRLNAPNAYINIARIYQQGIWGITGDNIRDGAITTQKLATNWSGWFGPIDGYYYTVARGVITGRTTTVPS